MQMPIMHDSNEWLRLLQDVGQLQRGQATISAEQNAQKDKLTSLEEDLDKKHEENTEKIDSILTLIHGDKDTPGIKGELLETKTILKHIRMLVVLLLMLVLTMYSPKIAEVIGGVFK